MEYKKSSRLLTRRDFQLLRKASTRISGRLIAIDYAPSKRGPRLGITVPKRCGKAPIRNRFKRVVREAFRSLLPLLPELNIIVHPRYSFQEASARTVAEELKTLLHDQAQPITTRSGIHH